MLLLSYDDTRRMIDNTIISYKGRLALATNVTVGLAVTLVDCETGERQRVLADMDELQSPNKGRLGYINRPTDNAIYLVRTASRVYKTGYSRDNLVQLCDGHPRGLPTSLGCLTEGIQDAYLNQYPTFAEALIEARKIDKIVAYDRSFAVSAGGSVYYQSHLVGVAHGLVEDAIVWTKQGLLASFVRNRVPLNWRK